MQPANRLKEPSTYAGMSALLALIGVNATAAPLVYQAIGALAGLVAILLPERKKG